MAPGKLEGLVALVTGASAGIGKSTAIAFSTEGAKVRMPSICCCGGVVVDEVHISKAPVPTSLHVPPRTQRADDQLALPPIIHVKTRW